MFGPGGKRKPIVGFRIARLPRLVEQPAEVHVRIGMLRFQFDGVAVGITGVGRRTDFEVEPQFVPRVGIEVLGACYGRSRCTVSKGGDLGTEFRHCEIEMELS